MSVVAVLQRSAKKLERRRRLLGMEPRKGTTDEAEEEDRDRYEALTGSAFREWLLKNRPVKVFAEEFRARFSC